MTVVLLIDDAPGMEKLVDMCLHGTGARVIRAHGTSEAVEVARRDPPSVVLLDLALEGEDGLEGLPGLRNEPALAMVPVVGFSVHGSREQEARALGVVGFVRKPFRMAALRDAVVPLLGPEEG
ncbi:MAG: response regulator [Actinomycetota bacterium]|nr:response regulator [Actinomycetota bacterium]